MKKIAIIYQGAVTLLEINYVNHKKHIFDYLRNENIDFDVFCSLANECVYKYTSVDKINTFVNIVNKKLNKNDEIKMEEIGVGGYKCHTSYIPDTTILSLLEKMFIKDKLKFIEFKDNYNNCTVAIEHTVIGDGHTSVCIPNTTFYKRIQNIDNFISTNKMDKDYTYYIYLRCDYFFYSNFTLKNYLIPNTVTSASMQRGKNTIRSDFIWISEKKYTEYINSDSVKIMNLIEPDNIYQIGGPKIHVRDQHRLYKYIESLDKNVILVDYPQEKGIRVGVWEYDRLPEEYKKLYFE
tara:strand:- start:117 stop:998 length:882 start_codon:yes stop_codon:yes gene_type:complete